MAEPPEPKHCCDCGSPLPEGRVDPLCPECQKVRVESEVPTELLDESPLEAPTGLDGSEELTELAQAPSEGVPAPTFAFSAGQVIGDRYRVVEPLGRGGMGEVWRAYDLKLRVDVALKSLLLSMGEGEEAREVLRAEVRAAREVISANVCRLFDIIEIGDQELVSMEYIDGQTLQKVLDERGPLAMQEAREIGAQFLGGLEAIHQAGLVHRDIKPENIMLTRSGRVVIMDFGLTAPSGQGVLAGTPAYMAPEQGRGEGTDARADVFSAAMVLAEMLSAERGPEASSRKTFWEDVRKDPPRLPETPWSRVLLKGVAAQREERYASAAELGRVLEEITVRVAGAEEEHPYPGLSSFGEADSRFFFGREAEVEAVWKRLQSAHLLGLIGSSGSGKSSFLNAGLLPARPDGWAYLKVNPGRAPFEALGRALLAEVAADAQALPNLEVLEGAEGARAALQVWRAQHPEALLVVDQFEELFTQNDLAAQEKFARLLSQAALEDGVRVLLSMRDDFLIHCQRFASLAPVFSELTPLGPPVGPALRRALTQPALSLGYRFEDDRMVEEMLTEVSRERGALPLIAFTTARLWEEREPDEGLLTRAAYDSMGGVGGALAGHAEATLEAIGVERHEIVREIFRNLVTAQGTRAVMGVEEVLSVFAGEVDGPEEVLQSLIEARLLTSYEVQTTEGEAERRQVEIVHESLLSSWPRLVHWRRQDAEGAQLRDELRQAAKLWESRGREQDLLWIGTAYREFELWRERYRGRLTALEEDYVAAMAALDQQQRRRRRMAVSAVLVAALAVAAVTGTLWRSSESARKEAISEALRAEASKLVALARLEEERYPTAALAYSTRSIEMYDTPEARRLALRVLWQGPVARVFPIDFAPGPCGPRVSVSPDGEWIAIDASTAELRLFSRQGVLEQVIPHPRATMGSGQPFCWHETQFSVDSRLLLTHTWFEPEVRIWSVPEGDLVRTLELGPSDLEETQPFWHTYLIGDRILTLTWSPERGQGYVQWWPLTGGEPENLGWVISGIDLWEGPINVDPSGTWLVYAEPGGKTIYKVPIASLGDVAPSVVWSHDEAITTMEFSPSGDHLLFKDESFRHYVGSVTTATFEPVVAPLLAAGQGFYSRMDRSESWVAWGSSVERSAFLWAPDGPPDFPPLRLRHHDEDRSRGGFFDPRGEWLATAHNTSLSFWSLEGPWSQAVDVGIQMHGNGKNLLFSHDGRLLATCPQIGLELWPLAPAEGERRKIAQRCGAMALHPSRPEFLMGIGSQNRDSVLLASIDGSSVRPLAGVVDQAVGAVAFDQEGSRAVVGIWEPPNSPLSIWSLESGELTTLSAPQGPEVPPYTVVDLESVSGGILMSAGKGGVRRWDLDRETSDEFHRSAKARIDLSPDGRFLLVTTAVEISDEVLVGTQLLLFDLENGTRREITTHGSDVQIAAFGPSGDVIVTGDSEGVVRVGLVSGTEPHLLLGHQEQVKAVVVSPDAGWIFSAAGAEIRRWQMPDLAQPPLHTLPVDDFLRRMSVLTNVTVVEDPDSPGGWRIEIGPF